MENLKCCGHCEHGKRIPGIDHVIACEVTLYPRPVEYSCCFFRSNSEEEENDGE